MDREEETSRIQCKLFFFFFFELLIFKYALDCIGSMEEDLMFSPIMRH